MPSHNFTKSATPHQKPTLFNSFPFTYHRANALLYYLNITMMSQTFKLPMKKDSNSSHFKKTGRFDTFSFYSNSIQRMKTLLMKDEEIDWRDSGARASVTTSIQDKNKQGRNLRREESVPSPIQEEGVSRKTVLSEVHPDLLLMDLYLEWTDDGSSSARAAAKMEEDEMDLPEEDDLAPEQGSASFKMQCLHQLLDLDERPASRATRRGHVERGMEDQ